VERSAVLVVVMVAGLSLLGLVLAAAVGAPEGGQARELGAEQDEAALDLLRASLSADGFAKSRDIMRLNGVLARLVDDLEEYGEDLYFFTVMGEPSATEPWGLQLDGHHLARREPGRR